MADYPSRLEHIQTEGFEYLYMQDRCNIDQLPTQSAVYLLVSHDFFRFEQIEVVYVGKTNSVKSRLKYPHPIETKYGSYLSTYILPTDEHHSLEREFIKRYHPKMNIQHNG